jgi:hypothetical protein
LAWKQGDAVRPEGLLGRLGDALGGLHHGGAFGGRQLQQGDRVALVATSTWPGLTWPMSMKAMVSASS